MYGVSKSFTRRRKVQYKYYKVNAKSSHKRKLRLVLDIYINSSF